MPNTILKRWNGTAWEEAYPKTTHTQIVASGTPSSSTFLRGDGQWVAPTFTVNKGDLTYLYIYGKAQSAITKGQAVQFAGVQGDHILLKPAVPSEINANPDYFVGIAEATLATNEFGYILTNGELVNVNTNSYTAGDLLWFASAGSTAGALTNVEPTGANAKIQVASVNKVDVPEGILFVRVNFVGTEIEDIVATGTASSTTFLRGDGQWAVPAGVDNYVNITGDTMTGDLAITASDAADSAFIKLHNTSNGSSVGIQFKDDTAGAQTGSLLFNHSDSGSPGSAYGVNFKFLTNQTNMAVIVPSGSDYFVGTSKVFHDGYHPDANTLLVVDTRNAGGRLPNDYADYRVTAEFTDDINGTWWSALTVKGWNDGYAPWQLIGYASTGSDERLFFRNGNGNANTWSALQEVWHSGSDGAGSGLDADLLDGNHASAFYLATNPSSYQTAAQVSATVAALVDSAPGTLDTLNELAAALGDDPNFATTVTNSIATKVAKSGDTMTGTLTSTGFHINDTATRLIEGSDNAIRLQTTNGYIDVGAMNASYAHIYTDRPEFYFNKELKVLGSKVFHDSYHPNADTLTTARDISLTGDVTGTASFNGSANISITAVVQDDSHNHIISNVDGLQTALDGKLGTTSKAADSELLDGLDSSAYLRDDGWNTSPGQDANTQGNMRADFTYANNAPWTGSLISFGAGGYQMQLNSAYNGGGEGFSFRTRNGDNATWNGWNRIFHDDYHPNADTLTTARTLTIGSTGKTFNGSANVSWSLTEIGAAPLASPALTGTPTAPTATAGTNTTQIATTAFVSTAVANLINSAPGALDTLDELAAALGDDANFASTITTALAGKQATITGAASTVTTSNLATLRAMVTDSNGKIAAAGSTTATEISYVNGVTSNIQTQLNGKASTSHTHAISDVTNLQTSLDAKASLSGATFTGDIYGPRFIANPSSGGNDTSGAWGIADYDDKLSAVRDYITDVYYPIYHSGNKPAIADVTSLQTALDGKEATITGAATTITGSNLTAFRVLGSDTSGKVAATSITTSTLAFLDATSSVQTQLNGKASTSHSHGNITSAGAIGSTANLGVVTTTSGVLTTRTLNDTTSLSVLSSSSTALTTERDIYWGTRYIHLGVTSTAGNGVSRTISFTSGMRNFILQLHQDTTTGAIIARLPLTISNSAGTTTGGTVYSLDTSTRTHRVAWSNGSAAQIMNVSISYSGTTITVSHNFGFNAAFRLFGY